MPTLEEELDWLEQFTQNNDQQMPDLILVNYHRWNEITRLLQIPPGHEKAVLIYRNIKFIWDATLPGDVDMVLYAKA